MRYDQISSSDQIPPGITFNRFGLMWSDLRSNRDNLTSFNILCVYWRFKYTNASMKFKWMHRKYKKWTKQQTHLLLLSNSPAPFSYVKDNGQLGTENASTHPSIWRDSPMKVIVLQVPSTKLKSSSQRAASPTKWRSLVATFWSAQPLSSAKSSVHETSFHNLQNIPFSIMQFGFRQSNLECSTCLAPPGFDGDGNLWETNALFGKRVRLKSIMQTTVGR